jgi:hypothetical protein
MAAEFLRRVIEEGTWFHGKQQLPYYSMLGEFRKMTADVYTEHCQLTPAGARTLAEAVIGKLETDQPHMFLPQSCWHELAVRMSR